MWNTKEEGETVKNLSEHFRTRTGQKTAQQCSELIRYVNRTQCQAMAPFGTPQRAQRTCRKYMQLWYKLPNFQNKTADTNILSTTLTKYMEDLSLLHGLGFSQITVYGVALYRFVTRRRSKGSSLVCFHPLTTKSTQDKAFSHKHLTGFEAAFDLSSLVKI